MNEITSARGEKAWQDVGIVYFETTLENAYRLNYTCRTANKIVLILDKSAVRTYEELYSQAYRIKWDNYFRLTNTFVVHSSVVFSKIDHSAYASLKVKDAVADHFRDKFKERPSVNKGAPDIYIELRIFRNESWLGINLSGEPLFKRGYKTGTNPAPLKETLAAGLAELAGTGRYKRIIDPMAGSGTLIIEAAMKHLNIPAGRLRSTFCFQKLKNYDPAVFSRIRKESDSRILLNSDMEFLACDHGDKFLQTIRENISKAGLSQFIRVKKQDFFKPEIDMQNSLILFNPPYGNRLKGAADLNNFYKKIGDTLKKECRGSTAYIFTEHGELIKHIGLRTSKRVIIFNGNIECRLLEFKMY
ncbi:MAG: THUMP domain-containing protein [bacterium]|nr:THUMP domain-containing protein [bacterium]